AEHTALIVTHAPVHHWRSAVDERRLHPLMTDVARIGTAQDARKLPCVLCRQINADHATAAPQEPIDDIREVGEFVDQKDVDFSALIFVSVAVILTMAEVDPRAVPEPDFLLDDLDEPLRFPRREESPKPLRSLHVVLNQIGEQSPKQIDL